MKLTDITSIFKKKHEPRNRRAFIKTKGYIIEPPTDEEEAKEQIIKINKEKGLNTKLEEL